MLLLDQFPVIPVIVIEDIADAKPLANALLEGGLNIIEVTFRSSAAASAIESIANAFPEMLVGAGTVVKPEQAKIAIDSGSKFASRQAQIQRRLLTLGSVVSHSFQAS